MSIASLLQSWKKAAELTDEVKQLKNDLAQFKSSTSQQFLTTNELLYTNLEKLNKRLYVRMKREEKSQDEPIKKRGGMIALSKLRSAQDGSTE